VTAVEPDRDPVCGMTVSPDSVHRTSHDGREYRFCSAGCLRKFQEGPQHHLKPRPPAAPPSMHSSGAAVSPPAAGTDWTCPMHPEIVRDRPGSCPICGMALEPRTVTAEEPENPELTDMRRRLIVCAALTAPLLVIMILGVLPGRPLHRLLSPSAMGWIELALATPIVCWGGWPFFVRGGQSIVRRSPNMFVPCGLSSETPTASPK